MTNIIVVTSCKEQQDVIKYILKKVNEWFDLNVKVVQSGINKIDVYHETDGTKYIAASYRVLVVPVSMSLDTLRGFPHSTNINISKLLDKLDEMKREAISFVNLNRVPSPTEIKQKEALAKAAKFLFE